MAQFLPDAAGGIIMRREPQEHMILTAWSGMAVLAARRPSPVVCEHVGALHRTEESSCYVFDP
ncbi:hypothetical protein [Streptomyces sp. NPDC058812]|uniref:hypothetical protein n=1 Tax=unclassified Streptomyces TaxID=2593676 RepID=UPI00369BFF41